MKISDLFSYPFYKQCWKALFLLLLTMLACKFSKGFFAGVIVLIGIWGAMSRRPAYALITFALLPFLTIMNPLVFNFGRALGICARLGMPLIGFAMMLAAAQRKGQQALPIKGLFVYIAVAVASSAGGYCPQISYLKLINFTIFLVGIFVGTKNIDRDEKGLGQLRAFLMAFSVFIIVGSLALHFINPFAAHFTAYKFTLATSGAEAAEESMLDSFARTGDYGFLAGVVNHSQCLGPTAACIAGWVLCDMLFVEKRFMLGHILTLILCPVVLYMTKSRTALLAFVTVVGIVTVYCVPKFRVSPRLKRRINGMIVTSVVLLVIAAVALEIKSGGVSKWLLKYTDDTREKVTMESLTSTRQGKIEEGMYDFRQNPLLGTGFQVAYAYKGMKMNGLVLSAPVEKGFIPTMILGETGVLGSIVFVAFLLAFYAGCIQKKYWVSIALMTTFLATNLGEATFFSPGGTGGPEWIYTTVGAFTIDMMTLVQRRRELVVGRPMPPMANVVWNGPRMPR